MAEVEDRLRLIAERLIAETSERNISWRMTDNESAFIYSGRNSSITVSLRVDDQGDDNITLSVLNSRGSVVGELRSTWVAVGPEPDDPWATPAAAFRPGKDNPLLETLYESARRSALQIDEVLNGLELDLGIDPF